MFAYEYKFMGKLGMWRVPDDILLLTLEERKCYLNNQITLPLEHIEMFFLSVERTNLP